MRDNGLARGRFTNPVAEGVGIDGFKRMAGCAGAAQERFAPAGFRLLAQGLRPQARGALSLGDRADAAFCEMRRKRDKYLAGNTRIRRRRVTA